MQRQKTTSTKGKEKKQPSRHKPDYLRIIKQFFKGYGWYKDTVSDGKLKANITYTVTVVKLERNTTIEKVE